MLKGFPLTVGGCERAFRNGSIEQHDELAGANVLFETGASNSTTSFPGSPILSPPGASEEGPRLGLVTCVPESVVENAD